MIADDANNSAATTAPPVEKDKTSSDHSEGTAQEVTAFETSGGRLFGWRFWVTMVGMYLGMYLVTLEMSVISTALVSITNDLHDFQHATWIVNAYFLTWSGFMVLWSQFSSSFGKKPSLLLAMGLFIIFSAGCAAAQSLIQLIILRALQGLAGAGVFSMPVSIISQAVPPGDLPKYTSMMALVGAISFSTGPVIGGAIVAGTSWRWVFIINVPIAAIAFAADLIALPWSFPYHNMQEADRPDTNLQCRRLFRHLDVAGAMAFLGICIPLVTALQEVEISYAWGSAVIIVLVCISAVSVVILIFSERHIDRSRTEVVPVMSWKFAERRTIGMFSASFLIGMPFVATMVQIPQRLQVVDGLSSLDAAVRLLPYMLLLSTGTAVGSIMGGKLKIRPVWSMLVGTAIQIVALVCFAVLPLASSPTSRTVPSMQYGFEILLGFGNGIAYTANFNGMPYYVGGRKALIAPAVGANLQWRYFGAAVGLGVTTAALNSFLRDQLFAILSAEDVAAVLETSSAISNLDLDVQTQVRELFAQGFLRQWQVLAGLSGLQVVAILFCY